MQNKIDKCNSYLLSFPRVNSPFSNLVYVNRYGTVRVNPYLIPRDYNTHKRLNILGKERSELELLTTKKEDIELKFNDKFEEPKGFLEPIKRTSLSKLDIK